MDFSLAPEILSSTIRMSVPLILACMAGLWSERAGIVDIGLEGKMLAAAFLSASVAAFSGSAWIGLLAGVGISVFFALVHGYASINQRGNQVISGLGINFIAAGLAVVIGHSWFKQGGRTPQLEGAARFSPIDFPGRDALFAMDGIGRYARILLDHTILTYVALAVVPLSAWVLARTRFGLRLRAVGENPQAVDTAGISVARLRYEAVVIAGVLCGVAGVYLSTALQTSFVRDMTGGRGYLALTALIFANWRAWPALFACLLFGFLQAIANFMQGAHFFGIDIPVQVFNSLPYVMTIVLLAGFIGKSTPPKASGIPYTKDR
ncbi:ABC transporter permease [Aestuariivirga litoralis]|uniref:ABC transporter permease n=1 Tax=Aestuariivirga litoralis TaxID=2650924 RepID=UPI0018C679C5|nr:ABC transporter permease [Aestuariivirga litoralis]MBG1232867.1 ABC transporter permease [Aestuariivirga litoralis]